MSKYTKKDAIRIISDASKTYYALLSGNNFLFIFRDRESNKIDFFETVFLPKNFQHLTGIEMVDKKGNVERKPLLFYERCRSGKLSESNIRFRSDGTTDMKLQALPKIVNFISSSRMTGIYNGSKPILSVDRLAGTVNFCLGFKLDSDYYAPSSCLLEDIRKLTNKPSQVLAIMSKKPADPIYCNIRYVAKGVPFDKLEIPADLEKIIDRSAYSSK